MLSSEWERPLERTQPGGIEVCGEVLPSGHTVFIRRVVGSGTSAVLTVTGPEWDDFVTAIKAGQFDRALTDLEKYEQLKNRMLTLSVDLGRQVRDHEDAGMSAMSSKIRVIADRIRDLAEME